MVGGLARWLVVLFWENTWEASLTVFAAIAQAILTPIFAKQVPFLERVALSTIDSNTDENGHV